MSEEIKEERVAPEKKAADEERASEMDFIYASAVESFSNLWDLRVVFGDRKPNGDIERRVAIVMSHRHAKALSQILANQVRRLEKAYGNIGVTGIEMEFDDVHENAQSDEAKGAKAGG